MPRKTSQPTLILLMGTAGTGKTTLARRILRHLSLVYMDNNFLADAFFPETRVDPAYLKIRPQLYAALYRVVEENLKVGNSVLLDAPHVRQCADPDWHVRIERLLRRSSASLAVLRCRCSEATLHARLNRRGEARDAWKLSHWEEFLETEPVDFPMPYPHLDIDTDPGSPDPLPRVLSHLRLHLRST